MANENLGPILDQLHNDLSGDLDRVLRRFKPGVKVTLVIRDPNNVERDVVIGDDDLNGAIEAIQRRIGASPHGAKPPCENTSPRWFTGHWRDWHRGHGCDKDDGRPRYMGAAREIAANTAPASRGCQREDCVGYCYWCTPRKGGDR